MEKFQVMKFNLEKNSLLNCTVFHHFSYKPTKSVCLVSVDRDQMNPFFKIISKCFFLIWLFGFEGKCNNLSPKEYNI